MSTSSYLLPGGVGPTVGASSIPAPAGRESRQRQDAAAIGNSVPAAASPESQDQTAASAAAISRAVTQLNDYVQTINRELQFSVDEASGHTVIKVLDALSGKVIRQIPGDEALALAQTVTPDGQPPRPGFLMVGKA
jgi:flagellar protein FlaG